MEQAIADVFRSTLFETTAAGVMTVESPGWSPVTAQLSNAGDGGYSIAYSESSGGSASFSGTLRGSKITGSFEEQKSGGNVVDGQENFAVTSISADFTAPVTWVSASQIPGPPGNLQIQVQGDAVTLSWAAASGNVSEYAIYRLVGLVNSAQQFLATTRSTSFTDDSAASTAPPQDEIFYYVYAVGPTGVENPQNAFGSLMTN